MAATAQNTNNTTIRSILLTEKLTSSNFTNWYRNLRIVPRYEKKMKFVEQTIGSAPDPKTANPNTIYKYYETVNLEQEVACLMLSRGRSVSKLISLEDEELLGHFGKPRNYNMHSMLKTIAELHDILKLYEKGIPKKAETPVVLAIREAELKKRKEAGMASTSGIFTIELYDFSNKTWVYDMVYGTHICNTFQGLRRSKNLKYRALSLYMGNGMRTAIEVIGSFDLIHPSGLIIVLHNYHFAPTVTRGVVSIYRLVENGYIHKFTNYGISISKDNVFYSNAIPHDGIYEIDMQNLYPNDSSTFDRDGSLHPTHDESLEKCKSCISGKMSHKPFLHKVERAKDLLGLIHIDVCGPFRTVTREGASYFITFTNDFSPYGYVYLMKHKREVFETFKVFQNEVENQLGKKIKAIQFDRGGEYLSHEFVNHIKSCGIVSQLTPPSTPKHNGASERRNQTLLDMQRPQTYNVDYGETFSPVTDIQAIRILLVIDAFYDYEIWQIDVKIAFLNGHLCEDVYMVQPKGFVDSKHPNKVCKLQRSIYGLKQASRSWNKRFDEEIKRIDFTQSRESAYILGIKIIHDRSKWLIALSQSAYLEKILKKFMMENSKKGYTPIIEKPDYRKSQGAKTPSEVKRMQRVPYASAIGSTMYAVRCTRPDVAFAQNLCSRFWQNPGEIHWTVVKTILNFQTDKDDTKSQTRYVFILNGGAVDWKSAKQSTTAIASIEAAAKASIKTVWMRKFIDGLGDVVPLNKRIMEMLCDNEPVIAISVDPGILKGA
nr:hypothetical protein [Tanacetum cinerariifolium]